jgi:GTPase
MNIDEQIRNAFPKLYVQVKTIQYLDIGKENPEGHIEYKRTLLFCEKSKCEKYASQMRWRIMQNPKKYAIYYIGVDDDGSIAGIELNDIVENIRKFITMTEKINASIVGIYVLVVNLKIVLKICVKIKKNQENEYDDISLGYY